MNSSDLRNLMVSSLVEVHRCVGGMYCFHLHGRIIRQASTEEGEGSELSVRLHVSASCDLTSSVTSDLFL